MYADTVGPLAKKSDCPFYSVKLFRYGSNPFNDTDGLETAAGLLQKEPSLKIIILTGYDLPVYRHEAKKLGIRGFLNKKWFERVRSLMCRASAVSFLLCPELTI